MSALFAWVKRRFREDPLFATAFVALAVATVVPIWIGRYLPLLDIPNHLSAIAVWHYYDDPRFDFSKYYTLNLAPLPYWAHYYFCHLLAYLVGVENANRIALTLYALALPTGTLLLARRFSRSPLLALFAFPLVWNFNLAEGFIAFVMGMALVVIGLAIVDRHAEQPSGTSALLVLAIGSSLYFFHLLDYMIFLVCAGLLVFTQRQPLSPVKLLQRGVPVLASCTVGLWAFRHQSAMRFETLDRGVRFGASLSSAKFAWDSLEVAMARAPERLLNFLAGSRDEWVVVILVAAWLALALTSRRPPPEERTPLEPRDFAIEACFVATLAAALFLPRSLLRPFNWYMINSRFVPLAALFGVLLLRGPIVGWRRYLLIPVVAASLFYSVDLSRMVVRFNHHVAGFDELVDQIPLHRSTLTLVFPPLGDPEVNVNCYNQWPSYAQLRRGGYNFYNFNQGFPLKYRTYKPAPPWSHPEWFNFDSQGDAWDYFLTHNERGQYELFEPLAKEGKVRLVGARGDWKLWQRVEAKAPAAK